MRRILAWSLALGFLVSLAAPLVAAEKDAPVCGPELSKKERKQVAVVKAVQTPPLDREGAIEAAKAETGREVEVLFDDRLLLQDDKLERLVQKEAAERGCWIAIITEVDKRQVGQVPRRVGGVTGPTIAEAVFRWDTTVHFGQIAAR